ncbi:hypothetical protein VPNG_02382 [Cytospora leucostoma]|uniref:Uncharacterized protein n=1 Tax=Cytospora leucostoma TaxID=1230097 RepID=A0A423XGV2_9PEZI|nr:hypothetical protein VPNG_02382 [Cytospora leucostoma]
MSSATGNTPPANVLGARDTNVPMTKTTVANTGKNAAVKGDANTMDLHRQALQAKIAAQKYDTAAAPVHEAVSKLSLDDRSGSNNYISPSDEIMSPCTAKLNALRNKQVGKVKPRSLFAQTSSKRLRSSEGLFGSKPTTPPSTS